MSREAMRQALDALEKGETKLRWAAISALKQALAEPEQEPVAWMKVENFIDAEGLWDERVSFNHDGDGKPLYTAPTPHKPQTTHWEGCEAVHPECRKPEQEPDGISWLKRDSGYFTAPTPGKPLTDEEIDRVTIQQWGEMWGAPLIAHRAYARAIERAHGITGETK